MYLGLAWILHKGKRDTQRLLVEAFMALGIAFLTLTVPLALDGRWSAATWALEGAALIWAGCRQGRILPRVSGALLQIASGVMFFSDFNAPHGSLPILNSAYLGGLMIAAASVFGAHTFQKYRREVTEYEQFHMGTLTFPDLPEADAARLIKKWTIKAGDVFDGSYPSRFTSDEIRPLQNTGHLPKSLRPEMEIVPATRIVNVRFATK